MTHRATLLVMLAMAGAPAAAQVASVTSLVTKDLVEGAGREVSVFMVEYPPRNADPVHTHDAQAFVYVLEGTVVMQVKGGAPVTLGPGQTFYEGPDDVHIVGRNASDTTPARLLVFMVKQKGAPLLSPVK
jgi:quercetin dioxygenase-like cupin family protein